jgi:hypothetical protein
MMAKRSFRRFLPYDALVICIGSIGDFRCPALRRDLARSADDAERFIGGSSQPASRAEGRASRGDRQPSTSAVSAGATGVGLPRIRNYARVRELV